jgi:multidrug efflux pump subunit AcrB
VGVGIVGLAGIVIKNGILLIEFTDELRSRVTEQGKLRYRQGRSGSFLYC